MENQDSKIYEKKTMRTLTSCLNSLQALGFETQFKASKNGLQSLNTKKIFSPNEVKISHYYRFEGESDPADNAIAYAIETNDGEKGTLVDAFGPYSDSDITKFMQAVEEIHK